MRSLKQFVSLAECLHFGRASDACHVSPSTLSRSIRRIEEELGAIFFERNNRSVALTQAGSLFLGYARDSLDQWDQLRNALMDESGQLSGEVRMYCSVTASYSFLFDILSRFRAEHPQVEIKLHTGDPEDAMARILAGDEDIAIGAKPDRLPAGLAFRHIKFSPLVFIRSIEQPELESRNWAETPMILSERGLARNRVDDWFRSLGLQPRIYAQVAGNEAIVSMVSLGLGVGVVPRIVLDNSPLSASVRVMDLEPALEEYEVGLFALEKRLKSPLVSAFWLPLE